MEKDEYKQRINSMISEIERLDVLEYIEIIVSDIKKELEEQNG